jgi:hypothetical protein
MPDEAPLALPSPLVPPTRKLASLPAEKFEALAAAFESYEGGTRDQFIKETASKVDMPERDVTDIVDMAIAVDILRQRNGWTREDTREQLASAERFPGKTKAERRALAERISRLVGHRGLSVVANAREAALANAQTFHAAQIVTDLRTVYAEKADLRPALALVVHELELSLHMPPDGRLTSSFVALDDLDLDSLSKQIETAKRRSAELREWLPSVGLQVVSPFGSDEHGGQR